MPSNRLIFCHPLLLLPSIFPSIRVFSSESALPIRWPKYWSFILFNGWVIFHCIHLPRFLYLVLCQWTCRLLPCLGYCKQWCNEHWSEASVSFKSPAGDANMQMNESHDLKEAMDAVGKDTWATWWTKSILQRNQRKDTWLWHQMKWSQVKLLSCVRLFATPWTIAYQASPVGFSRQEYWSELPFPSPEDLPHPGIKPGSPAL